MIMKKFHSALFISCILLSISGRAQTADHPVVSEIRYDERSGINEEFVELYNPTSNPIFLEDWTLSYKSKTGTAWRKKVTFGPEHVIRPYGFFLWGGDAVDPLPDVIETSQRSVGLSNSGGHIALINTEAITVDLVAWEGGDSPEGSADAGKTKEGGSLERKASAESTSESMATGGDEVFSGNGRDTDNNGADFVIHPLEQVTPQNSESDREPDPDKMSGHGTAEFISSWAFGSTDEDIRLSIRSETDNTIEQVAVLPPWESGNVFLEGGFAEAALSFSGDTLLISDIALSGNQTITCVFSSVHLPLSSGKAAWPVFTRTEAFNGLLPIRSFPVFQVLPPCMPVSSLHKNNPDGIPTMLGDTVAVEGTVTAGSGIFSNEFTDVFIQDSSGGIKVFDNEIPVQFASGDHVIILGVLDQFHGMTEIIPVWEHVMIRSKDNPLPPPASLCCREVDHAFQADGSEPDEARLIRLQNVTYDPVANALTDTSGTCGIYLCPQAGLNVPPGRYNITGLLSQYTPDAQPPHTDHYSIQPRFQSDIEPAAAVSFLTVPEISGWAPDGVTLAFETSVACDVIVNYGSTDDYTEQIEADADPALHQISLTGLQAASIYHYQVICRLGSDEIHTPDALFVTRAPDTAPGTIHIYFNGSVESGNSRSVLANGNEDLYARLAGYMDAAGHTIDACFMKLTHPDVRDALIEAHDRGVSVRFICEQDQSGGDAIQSLIQAGIPVVTDTYGNNDGSGCMHHKFAVFDRRDDASLTDDWVWTGSFNLTDYGAYPQPFENAIAVQDPALAAVYTDGFNRMWGSGSETPDPQTAGFGSGYFQSMPHRVMIGETLAEVYFSPDGGGMEAIHKAIASADFTIDFSMFSFTRHYLADALVQSSQSRSVPVRGLMDSDQIQSDDTYSQWNFLHAELDDRVRKHTSTKRLHHKYAVIDGCEPDSDPLIITGSYNWTHNAEQHNNENVLILHNADGADQYLQEFEARYQNASGANTSPSLPTRWNLRQNYPNPFNGSTSIDFTVPGTSDVSIHVLDIRGRTVKRFDNRTYSPGQYSVWWNAVNDDGTPVSSGVYLIRLKAPDFTDQMKTVLLQ